MSSPALASVEPLLDTLRDLSVGNSSKNIMKSPPGALFSRLKAVNRSSNAAAATRRELTAEARTQINETNLGLQNLMYERRYLEREIEKCRSYAFIYQDVPLHPLADFEDIAPEELRSPEVMSDEHQLMLNRLSFELAERQRLEAKRQALVEERDSILADTKKFQTEVDKLADPFEKLEEMTRSVQQMIHQIIPSPPPPPTIPQGEDAETAKQEEEPVDEASQESSPSVS